MPPLAAVPDLDRELDALYALPLEEFTKARNDLASRLRKAHQGEAADQVRALRKPSAAAWAANSLARSSPDLITELLAAGERLREVQQSSLAGKAPAEEVSDATARERDAVRALLSAARREIGKRATTPQLLERLSQTLRAAAIDPQLAPALAAGRLTEDLRAVGFGPLEAVAPQRRTDDAGERRSEREHLAALRAEARRLAAEAREAETAAHDAARTAQQLEHLAMEKRNEAERAATELAEAETER
jgi:D-serine deaminase-like pyridoxal phosphate-dependent protein